MAEKIPFEEFQRIYSRVPRICVDLLIETERGFLLSKRTISPWEGAWHFPGGGVRFRESLHECAQRIAREELGIEIEVRDFLGMLEYPFETVEGDVRHSMAVVLRASPKSEEFVLNEEASEVRFFKDEIPGGVIPIVGEFLKEINILNR